MKNQKAMYEIYRIDGDNAGYVHAYDESQKSISHCRSLAERTGGRFMVIDSTSKATMFVTPEPKKQ